MSIFNKSNMNSTSHQSPNRHDGYLPLEDYGAIGEGRSVALSGRDGSIDWWCVPNMDSPPLFDRLLDAEGGGFFVIEPDEPYTATRTYRKDSNVLETVYRTSQGVAVLTESMNSGTAGRLPWAELARRIDGRSGSVTFRVEMKLSRRGNTVNPYHSTIGKHVVFHVGTVLGLLLYTPGIECTWKDEGVTGCFSVVAGDRKVFAIVAGRDEPLVVPEIDDIDNRIDISDDEWRIWAKSISYKGPDKAAFVRSALVLKLLLHSPSGAIAAAPTTSVPERIGGNKNYDYRYAWVRDAGYTIKAFLAAGAEPEAKAAFSWLLAQLKRHGPKVCYTLDGELVDTVTEIEAPGYRNSRPVVLGNVATNQHQHGIYGDIFETAARFVDSGNILDSSSAELLAHLADECADRWRMRDAGIWELEENQHYTMSKVSCWQALARAVELADQGQLPTTCRDRWVRERDRIKEWIETNCWSEKKKAFVMYPGSSKLDASLALAVRFGFDGHDRLKATIAAIDKELGRGPFHYRYSGADKEEGCFLACSFWMIEAHAILGNRSEALKRFEDLNQALQIGVGIFSEMIDPKTGEFLGNLPQGLTHLAHLMTLSVLHDECAPETSEPPTAERGE